MKSVFPLSSNFNEDSLSSSEGGSLGSLEDKIKDESYEFYKKMEHIKMHFTGPI